MTGGVLQGGKENNRVSNFRRTKYQVRQYDPNLPPDAPTNTHKCPACNGYIFPLRYYTDKVPQCNCRTLKTQHISETHA